jgi:hypothetical protein
LQDFSVLVDCCPSLQETAAVEREAGYDFKRSRMAEAEEMDANREPVGRVRQIFHGSPISGTKNFSAEHVWGAMLACRYAIILCNFTEFVNKLNGLCVDLFGGRRRNENIKALRKSAFYQNEMIPHLASVFHSKPAVRSLRSFAAALQRTIP